MSRDLTYSLTDKPEDVITVPDAGRNLTMPEYLAADRDGLTEGWRVLSETVPGMLFVCDGHGSTWRMPLTSVHCWGTAPASLRQVT